MTTETTDKVWQDASVATLFLEGVRGAIPLAAEQLDVMVRVVRQALGTPRRALDLGCGDGILGRTLMAAFGPSCEVVFADLSAPMLAAARARLAEFDSTPERANVRAADFTTPAWIDAVRDRAPFDLIVSGFAIHHQPDARKRALYAEIFGLLAPAGLFLNMEHVASASALGAAAFDDLFIDSLFAFERRRGGDRTRDELAQQYYHRPDKAANILAPVDRQCGWLRAIGFEDVDCFFKIFELALFGGRRPNRAPEGTAVA